MIRYKRGKGGSWYDTFGDSVWVFLKTPLGAGYPYDAVSSRLTQKGWLMCRKVGLPKVSEV